MRVAYNRFAADPDLRAAAAARTADFVESEAEFHLGVLPTEGSHPITKTLSDDIAASTTRGIAQLLAVDGELTAVARRAVVSAAFDTLVDALHTVASDRSRNAPRVCFSGCGSTGRLAILLEAMWREFWTASDDPTAAGIAARASSIMTGGDRALIRSVENFEDYHALGARQVADLALGPHDLLIAVSEGGETSSVLGTVAEALRRGVTVVFVYNNPTALLADAVDRSRVVIEDPRVTTLDLFSGPMALSGSTRMQATTLELLVLGIAMEAALTAGDRGDTASTRARRLRRVDHFARLLASLGNADSLATLAALTDLEHEVYAAGGLVTYFADRFLLDVFSDTTERTPTFMLPAFRRSDDRDAPVSWAFAKDALRTTEQAWHRMLGRTPRGLNWDAAAYRAMGAPQSLVDAPPALNLDEIVRYRIGNEADASRWDAPRALALPVVLDRDSAAWAQRAALGLPDHVELVVLAVRSTSAPAESGVDAAPGTLGLQLEIEPSPVALFHHLALKLVFNTVSTASMALAERIRGNWMIQVDPTNKKLIDRATRIIADLAQLSYRDACSELFISMEARRRAAAAGGDSTDSPVVAALDRLGRW